MTPENRDYMASGKKVKMLETEISSFPEGNLVNAREKMQIAEGKLSN